MVDNRSLIEGRWSPTYCDIADALQLCA